jgi:hypothetical protein
LDSSHIQPTALSVIGKTKQHKTFSPRAWSPGNSGQAFFNLWTCPLWCTIDMWNPLQNGEEYLGERCQNRIEKGFNSPVILGAWILWKHRNSCIFDGSTPSVQVALQAIEDESHSWISCGAKGLALSLGRAS